MNEFKRIFHYCGDWLPASLSDLTRRVGERNRNPDARVLTISAQHGLIDQELFFNKRVASKDLSNYLVLREGDFAYNKSYSKGYPFGAIKRQTRYPCGVVSPLYICFRPNPSKVDPDYLEHLLEAGALDSGISSIAKEGARAHGLVNVGVDAFFDLPLRIAPRREQTKIAEILSTIDQAIRKTEALVAKQQRIKIGLMQDLLTRGIDAHGDLRTERTHKFKDSALGRIPVEWEVSPIERKLECIIDYRGRTPCKTDSGIPLITAKNVREGYLSQEPREFIAAESYESWMTRGIPAPGDVIFTTEAPMGNVARIPEYKVALAQRLITLPTKEKELSSDFLFWTLHWPRTLDRLKNLTSGSTVEGIKQSVFRKVAFCLPPPDEQSRITSLLESQRRAMEDTSLQLAKFRTLKTALSQDLLTGEKRVTDLL